jgi:hypothetical protein
MCEHCQPASSRRSLLSRAGAGGALLLGWTLWRPDIADAATPRFESMGLGEERMTRASVDARLEKRRTTTAKAPKALKPKIATPTIVTRADWGADESIRKPGRQFVPVRKLVVHHTASPSNPSDPAKWVRMTYEYHTVGRGYSDIGYNFMIDQNGRIYEGRWARTYAKGEIHDGEDKDGFGVIGAHALGVNAASIGICMLGDFSSNATGKPTDAAIAALTQLLAWECSRHQIDPLGNDEYISMNGARRVFPNIAGHRDVGATGCPGGNMYKVLPAIRQTIASQVGRFPAATIDPAVYVRWSGFTTPPAKTPPTPAATPPVVRPGLVTGVRVLSSDGKVAVLGTAASSGSPAANGVRDPIAIAGGPKGSFVTLDSRGGVLAFSPAKFRGSLTSVGVSSKPADISAAQTGAGYWILTKDGGIYGFGDVRHYGSPKKTGLNLAARKIVATPSGRGYWVLTSSGGILFYGDATVAGQPKDSGTPFVDLAPTPTGRGYWVVDAKGKVYAFGDAQALGGLDSVKGWKGPIVAVVASPSGQGYSILAADGTVGSFGTAPSKPGRPIAGKAVGLAPIYV